MPRLLAVDGTALAFRAFFAIRHLSDAQGRPTGALFGYLSSLLRALQDHPADAVVVAWDSAEPTFRHAIDAEYKATREDMDEDLAAQLPWMREATELLGIPSLAEPGFEADDILASLGTQAAARGWEARLFSGDKDLAQVVGEGVRQCPPPKGDAEALVLGPAEIEEKYGLPPERMAEWQALVGDSSDNVRGVPGVGPKRATALLQKYGSLEAVLERGPGEEKGKLAQNLAEHADSARRALQLVTMRTDMELGDPGALAEGAPDWDGLQEFCRAHDLNALAQRLQEYAGAAAAGGDRGAAGGGEGSDEEQRATGDARTPRAGYRLVADAGALRELRDGLRDSGGFAFDTETTSTDPMRARLVGMSFSWKPETAWYVAENLPEPPRGPQGEGALEFLAPVLEDPRIPKYAHNLKYDLHVMRRAGVTVRGWEMDTMIAHALADPAAPHNLDAVSEQLLGLSKIPTKELLGSGRNQRTMDQVPVEAVADYACEDADAVFRLVAPLEKALGEGAARKLFDEVEMPLVLVLARMEEHGVRVDKERLREMRERLGKQQLRLERRVHELAGEPFNLNSPKQLGPVLFEKLRIQDEAGVKRPARTKTGYRTDAGTLERYRGTEIVDALLEYRQHTKLIGTYVDALPGYVHPETGCVHTSYHQAVAATGRLSSSGPNLQNIPIRTDAGREIRRAFVPREPGWVMLSADYSQIELRVVAHLSEDPALIEAFREDADIHARTAALIFGVDEAEVDATMRARAKAINFGILYGMGPARLARDTGIGFAEARAFIEQYFEALPGVRRWLDRILEEARRSGEVRTLLGRRRPIPGLDSADGRVRSQAENVAVNTPVQGSAADLIKVAMLRVDERLRREERAARMIMQVHDELVFDCPAAEEEDLAALVREEMEGAWELRVPLRVDVGSGPDWSAAH